MKIVWTRLALQDLEAAREYIAAEDPDRAAVVMTRIERSLEALRSYPFIGRRGRAPDTPELVILGTSFIIPYQVVDHRIEVLAVMHAARKWPDSFSR